jgi:hypothetical protein
MIRKSNECCNRSIQSIGHSIVFFWPSAVCCPLEVVFCSWSEADLQIEVSHMACLLICCFQLTTALLTRVCIRILLCERTSVASVKHLDVILVGKFPYCLCIQVDETGLRNAVTLSAHLIFRSDVANENSFMKQNALQRDYQYSS